MKIKSLTFNNIRSFSGNTNFNFSDTKPVTTISGKNGSGKTTIFKSLILCQKAFFISQLSDLMILHEKKSLTEELKKYFINKGSSIYVSFRFENELDFDCNFGIVCTAFTKTNIDWELRCTDESKSQIKKYWNFENPSEIIVFVESDKHFLESDVSHENISVQSGNKELIILDTVLHPDKLFSTIYQSLINGYLRERLVPSKPKADIYFLPTKIFLKHLLPNLTISNFSGQQLSNQFVLLAKSSREQGNYFDIRNFSSGEKTLFYILLFINYVQKIGLLIIDEPENHFHEELLINFVKTLKEICVSKNHMEVIEKTSKKIKFNLTRTNQKELKQYYQDYNLSQVILLTHSKNLIYNNFVEGSNFYLDGILKTLEYESLEKTLRTIGISSIYSKVLFVEGKSETEYFDLFLNEYNIKTHSLNGCSSVIDTYKRFLEIKRYLKDFHFCFMIDKDTRSKDDLEKLRSQDEAYFDEHFITLEKHEFENYFLDPKIFKAIIDRHSEIYEDAAKFTLEEIQTILFKIASKDKSQLIKKIIKKKNHDSIDKLKEKLIVKGMPTDQSEYMNFYNDKLKQINPLSFLETEFKSNHNSTVNSISDETWEKEWMNICDGKITLNKSTSEFAELLQIKKQRFNQELKEAVKKNANSFEVNELLRQILKKFDK